MGASGDRFLNLFINRFTRYLKSWKAEVDFSCFRICRGGLVLKGPGIGCGSCKKRVVFDRLGEIVRADDVEVKQEFKGPGDAGHDVWVPRS